MKIRLILNESVIDKDRFKYIVANIMINNDASKYKSIVKNEADREYMQKLNEYIQGKLSDDINKLKTDITNLVNKPEYSGQQRNYIISWINQRIEEFESDISLKKNYYVFIEDLLSKGGEYFYLFFKNNHRFPKEMSKNLMDYKTLNDIKDVVLAFKENLGVTFNPKNVPDSEVIVDKQEILIVTPKTMKASCTLGKGTEWCTATEDKEHNRFDYYDEQGPLYIIFDKRDGKRYQFHLESGQFMDEKDRQVVGNKNMNKIMILGLLAYSGKAENITKNKINGKDVIVTKMTAYEKTYYEKEGDKIIHTEIYEEPYSNRDTRKEISIYDNIGNEIKDGLSYALYRGDTIREKVYNKDNKRHVELIFDKDGYLDTKRYLNIKLREDKYELIKVHYDNEGIKNKQIDKETGESYGNVGLEEYAIDYQPSEFQKELGIKHSYTMDIYYHPMNKEDKQLIPQRVIYREGQRYHREDGPAIIDYDQNGRVAGEEYYLAGRKYSKEQFIEMTGAKLESRIRINKFIIF